MLNNSFIAWKGDKLLSASRLTRNEQVDRSVALLNKFDAIVVGAGTAGCMAAKTIASAGLSVCLIDRKERKDIGNKVCGEAIGRHHFDNLGLAYPEGNELEREIHRVDVHSPDMETTFSIKGEGLDGFMIDRHLFGQRLLKDALDNGALLKDSTQVLEPIVREGFVRGVHARNRESDRKIEFAGRCVLDASGIAAAIRSKLPPEMDVETEVSRRDLMVCYREVRILKGTSGDPDVCDIYFDLEAAPGGYSWIFPKAQENVNVGLGVVGSARSVNPKEQLHKYILSKPLFEGSTVIHGGGGIVPTRKPLDSMVANGAVIVGDAGCHVNPIHGGGMGSSMIAGMISGETLIEALEKDDLNVNSLWPANVRYMQLYGAKQAGLDIFRIFLQGLNNDDLNYGMMYRLIREEDILKTTLGEAIHLNVTEKTRRIFRGIGRLMFLKKLYNMVDLSRKIKTLCRNYPSTPKNFPDWKAKVQALYETARTQLG
jgi:digeranylgeranylglycerophospholipid reductase